jgi:hypothetical protein
VTNPIFLKASLKAGPGNAGHTLVPHVTALPADERFLLWTLRQWRTEIVLFESQQKMPAGGSSVLRAFKAEGLQDALPHFAMVMDAFLSGAVRPLEIYPLAAPIVGPDEATLLALFGLARDGLEMPLTACLQAMLAPQSCAVAVLHLKLFAGLLSGTGPCSTASERSACVN